jgi:prepilin-type N-terminal cleavage/methylation domain-containing protein
MNTPQSNAQNHAPTRAGSAFTLVELLIVISIIGVLVALLLPALSNARQIAVDTRCAAGMRGTLIAVANYNADFPATLQNARSACPYWGKGFPNGDTGAGSHWALNDGSSAHSWNEGRAFWPYWRRHLAKGGYVGVMNAARDALINSSGLGCSAYDYSTLPPGAVGVRAFWGSFNGGNYGDSSIDLDSNFFSASYSKNPAFLWLGPGIYDTGQTSAYYGNIVISPSSKWSGITGPMTTVYDKGRGPLFACPQPAVFYNGVYKLFENPHRPQWPAVTTPTGMPYAQNVGFTDGSVRFYQNPNGGLYDPTR